MRHLIPNWNTFSFPGNPPCLNRSLREKRRERKKEPVKTVKVFLRNTNALFNIAGTGLPALCFWLPYMKTGRHWKKPTVKHSKMLKVFYKQRHHKMTSNQVHSLCHCHLGGYTTACLWPCAQSRPYNYTDFENTSNLPPEVLDTSYMYPCKV